MAANRWIALTKGILFDIILKPIGRGVMSGHESGCECETCNPPFDHVEACERSMEAVANAALEFTFIDGSGDYTAKDRAQALSNLHVTASMHRRRREERVNHVRQWLANEDGSTPPEFAWFGCETDKDLLDAVDAEMVNWKTQVEALEVMLYG